MVINYPNGEKFQKATSAQPSLTKKVNYGNRGMSLEQEINKTNQYYRERGIAVIHKKPIPIQIVNVDYPKRSAAVIKEAYFRQASTTDYNGVYKSHYLDFEAKETKNKTSFPLNNFHEHQIDHMKACQQQGGICFTIIKFSLTQEIYLVPAEIIFEYWDRRFKERKSIPKSIIQEAGYFINYKIQPLIPYLNIVDHLISQRQK
ncbi:Holliday junction resolvase RecU [Ligilactobacillus ceti]|uniref:Holliday junction resolvase RecU n=1 Tax=Ligilactobacillus ceti DSM 22408 TaxID=1122146 RepID=A0A0R2KS40_9LACO|nr:Holliday junction resolvase RecU [Ligilactobacillus ceti]KRN88900.1 recombination protein U [Ligilactobacillus ceti DSM 22408]